MEIDFFGAKARLGRARQFEAETRQAHNTQLGPPRPRAREGQAQGSFPPCRSAAVAVLLFLLLSCPGERGGGTSPMWI